MAGSVKAWLDVWVVEPLVGRIDTMYGLMDRSIYASMGGWIGE